MSILAVSLRPLRAGIAVGTSAHVVSFSAPIDAPALANRVDDLFAACAPAGIVVIKADQGGEASDAIIAHLEALAGRCGATIEYREREEVRTSWLGRPQGSIPEMLDEAEAREFSVSDVAQIEAIAALDMHFSRHCSGAV